MIILLPSIFICFVIVAVSACLSTMTLGNASSSVFLKYQMYLLNVIGSVHIFLVPNNMDFISVSTRHLLQALRPIKPFVSPVLIYQEAM